MVFLHYSLNVVHYAGSIFKCSVGLIIQDADRVRSGGPSQTWSLRALPSRSQGVPPPWLIGVFTEQEPTLAFGVQSFCWGFVTLA